MNMEPRFTPMTDSDINRLDGNKLPCHGVVLFKANFTSLLLVKTRHNHWGFPKGKRHKGELPIEAGLRELREETGVTPEMFSILTVQDGSKGCRPVWVVEPSKKGTPTIGLMIGQLNPETETALECDSDELEQVDWISVESILNVGPELFHDKRKRVVKDALELVNRPFKKRSDGLILQPSLTLAAKKTKMVRISNNLPVYDAGLGENPLPPSQSLIKAVVDNASKSSYTGATGTERLRLLLGNNLLVGNGLKPLLYTIQNGFQLLFPERDIFYITPAWVSYLGQGKTVRRPPKLIRTDQATGWKLTVKSLESTLSTSPYGSLLVFNNPTNPTGQIYTREELAEFVPILIRYGTMVLYDEIYAGIVYPEYQEKFIGLDKLYPNNCMVGNSLSKLYAAGGYRLGWIRFPNTLNPDMDRLYRQVVALASITYSCPSELFNHVAETALSNPDDVKQQIQFQSRMFSHIGRTVKRLLMGTKIRSSLPQAAWYIWLDFSALETELSNIGVKDSIQLTNRLVEEIGLITVPGIAFGDDKLSLRYSFVQIDGIEPVTGLFDETKLLEGLRILCGWAADLGS